MKRIREVTVQVERRRTRRYQLLGSTLSCPLCGKDVRGGSQKQLTLDEIKAKKQEDFMKNKSIICVLLTLGLFFFLTNNLAYGCEQKEKTIARTVELRPGVTSTVKLTILTNPSLPWGGRTLLAIPGGFMTGETMRPLAQTLFSNQKFWPLFISHVVLVNLPGHGGSSYPTNLPFGVVTLDDYAHSLLGILDQLKNTHLEPDVVIGHCMTATLLQIVQQHLISEGTNLRKKYGIREVIMLAPDPPEGVYYSRTADPVFMEQILTLMGQSIVQDPQLGPIVRFAPQTWLGMFFMIMTDPLHPFPVPNTPFDFMARGYNNDEPLVAFLETIGFGVDLTTGNFYPTTRSHVDAGVFAPHQGTCLRLMAFQYDFLFAPEDQQAIYRFLTGDENDQNFVVINKEDAVHAMFISNPEAVANAWLKLAYPHWDWRR
jgi:pimeloyl-ACP methyl ester carboxylesterase